MEAVHCIIERDSDNGFVGRVVGFEHFAVTGPSADDVEAKLRSRVLSMHETGSLVLETEFVRSLRIELP